MKSLFTRDGSGFWPGPRQLSYLLESGEITRMEFALVCWVGMKGGDRGPAHRVPLVTYRSLAAIFGRGDKTIERALKKLKKLDLLDYQPPGQGSRKPFPLRLGAAMIRPERDAPRSELQAKLRVTQTEVTSDGTSDATSPADGDFPSLTQGSRSDATSDTSLTGLRETETETIETKLAFPTEEHVGNARSLALPPQRSRARLQNQSQPLAEDEPPGEAQRNAVRERYPARTDAELDAFEALVLVAAVVGFAEAPSDEVGRRDFERLFWRLVDEGVTPDMLEADWRRRADAPVWAASARTGSAA